VQFPCVCLEQGSPLPVLVMEYLHTTLFACLERYDVLPKEISYGILHDVALGLVYLHEPSPPIIHRDLSVNNALLTANRNAKLSDLGVTKILNLTPAQMTKIMQTKAPAIRMPPVSKVECRAEYLQEIGNDHPLMGLIPQYLSNMPTRRPGASALLELVNVPQIFTKRHTVSPVTLDYLIHHTRYEYNISP